MDVVWLLTRPKQLPHVQDEAWRLIAAMDDYGASSVHTDDLYEHLLPTIGGGVIKLIVDRVKNASPDKFSPHPRLAESALVAAAQDDPAIVSRARDMCLAIGNSVVQDLGLLLANRYPDATQLDRVWELHHNQTPKGGTPGRQPRKSWVWSIQSC